MSGINHPNSNAIDWGYASREIAIYFTLEYEDRVKNIQKWRKETNENTRLYMLDEILLILEIEEGEDFDFDTERQFTLLDE